MMRLVIIILYRLVNLYSTLMVFYALMSWFPNAYDTFIGRLLIQIVEPVLAPFRKLNLRFGGLDFTVWVAILVLNYLARFIIGLLY